MGPGINWTQAGVRAGAVGGEVHKQPSFMGIGNEQGRRPSEALYEVHESRVLLPADL